MVFSSRAGFRYPIEPAPRTAVLVDWFGHDWFGRDWFGHNWFQQGWFCRGSCRVFPRGWGEQAATFSPAAIAGTLSQLLELAERASPPVLTHAVIVLARTSEPVLSATDRDNLWRAFRVPLFEQIIGPRGELLAAECEAHAGLHIEAPGLGRAGCSIETSVCACGRATPRLTPLERLRGVAAYAR